MIRDLSPTAYTAPGTCTLALSLILSDHSPDAIPLDVWVSNYSPSYDVTTNLSSGFNAITIPDTTNSRYFIVIPPRGNTTGITLKGITGDTGIALNPNGLTVLSLPSTSPPASIGLTAASGITGVRIIIP